MQRLDVLIFQRKLTQSREKAIEFIKSGAVQVNGRQVTKPGTKVEDFAEISITPPYDFVSRAGQKLAFAIQEFRLSFANLKCLDIGASTGGFTDCMLKHGAHSVVALDVGSEQLDKRLRSDGRVLVMENTNIRSVTADSFPHAFDAITIDVSFISLTYVLPVAITLLRENGFIVALLKPQFEAGKGQLNKKGIFRSKSGHVRVIRAYISFLLSMGWHLAGFVPSPIQGGSGNIEYLSLLKKGLGEPEYDVEEWVKSAFSKFGLR